MPKDYYPRIVEEVEDRVFILIAERLPTHLIVDPDNIWDKLREFVKDWVSKWSQHSVLDAYWDRRHLANSASALRVEFMNKYL